jgi:hypothetical protein
MRRKILVLLAALGLAGVGCGDPKPDPNAAPSVVLTTGGPAAKPPGEILARIHFIGTDQLALDTNATTLNRIGLLKETAALKKDILDKLSTAPGRSIGLATNVSAELTASIRPLLADLISAETYLEVRDWEGPMVDLSGGGPEWAVAVKLSEDRVKVWDAALRTILAKLGKEQVTPIQIEGVTGWEATMTGNQDVFRFVSAKGWAVFGSGPGTRSLPGEMVASINVSGAPAPSGADDALGITIDFPRLVEETGWTRWSGLPYVDIQSRVVKDNVRSTGSLVFPEALGLKTEAWKIPTNSIHDPLISFTAVKGIAPWLEKQEFYQAVKLEQTPNQAFAWAMVGPFSLSYIAVPAPDSTNQMRQLFPRLEKISNEELKKRGLGSITNIAKSTMSQWTDAIPMAARPYIRTSEEPSDDFLMMGLFPVDHGVFTNPPPAALVGHVASKKDVIYYDWEITQARLTQLKLMFQFASWISDRPKLAADTSADKWVHAIGDNLGNTATEITLASPREMKLVRRSHLGLSAFEIMTLAYWVADEKFPLSESRLPFLPLSETGGMLMPVGPPPPQER